MEMHLVRRIHSLFTDLCNNMDADDFAVTRDKSMRCTSSYHGVSVFCKRQGPERRMKMIRSRCRSRTGSANRQEDGGVLHNYESILQSDLAMICPIGSHLIPFLSAAPSYLINSPTTSVSHQ